MFGDHAYPQIRFPKQGYIKFNPPFSHTPAVVYGLYMLDSSNRQNVRLTTTISGVSKNGFTMRVATFSGTEMWGARISWMACPKSF